MLSAALEWIRVSACVSFVQVLRERLLYAIYNCVEMDGDYRLTDTEMTGWD